MTPREALEAALPPRAAAALELAQQFDPTCDPACALLAAYDHPDDSIGRLALRIRATTRREKRAGGAHGPSKFIELDGLADQPAGDAPCALLEAVQEVAARPDLAAALAEREGASDTRALAQRDGCTRRRVQQALALRRRVEDGGQMGLWGGGAT